MRLITIVVLQLLSWMVCAWALMLLLGVLHHELSPAIPAIGYGPTFRIALAASLVTGVWALFYGIAKEITK